MHHSILYVSSLYIQYIICISIAYSISYASSLSIEYIICIMTCIYIYVQYIICIIIIYSIYYMCNHYICSIIIWCIIMNFRYKLGTFWNREHCMILTASFRPLRNAMQVCLAGGRNAASPRNVVLPSLSHFKKNNLEHIQIHNIYIYTYIYIYIRYINILNYDILPRCSMYGIFTYNWAIFGTHVGK